MQIDFINVIFTVFSLILLAVPGYILKKVGFVGDKATSALSNIVLYVCQPALVFMGFQGKEFSASLGVNMLIMAGLAIAIHLIMAVILCVCVRNKDNQAKLNCLRFASIFGNCGFMGLPLIQSLFAGQDVLGEAIIYCAVMIAVFNILTWTLGVYLISKNKKEISLVKIIKNPTIIAVVLGFIVFVIAKIPLVDLCVEGSFGDVVVTKFMSSVNLLGNAVTPMSLMVIGIKLASVDLKTIFIHKLSYVNCFFKLIVASLVTILAVTFLPVTPVLKYAIFFLFSMPSATSTTLYAVKYNSDAESASIMVLLSSILSMLTVPLMFLFYTGIFGSFI
jgi:predicted permease